MIEIKTVLIACERCDTTQKAPVSERFDSQTTAVSTDSMRSGTSSRVEHGSSGPPRKMTTVQNSFVWQSERTVRSWKAGQNGGDFFVPGFCSGSSRGDHEGALNQQSHKNPTLLDFLLITEVP